MMETFVSVALGLALSAACGMRVFLPLMTLSLAMHAGRVEVAREFAWLGSDVALLTLIVAALAESLAYFIPWLDHLLDMVALPCAIVAGALTSTAAIHGLPPHLTWGLAVIGGGGSAGLIRAATSVARVKSTLLTGGFGNVVIAFIEVVAAAFLCLAAIFVPLFALSFLVGIAILSFIFLKKTRGVLFQRRAKTTLPGTDGSDEGDAMYKIIGTDGMQYGPVTEEQLRDWIAQGRVNVATLVQQEGTTEWKPLGQFQEFAHLVVIPVAPPAIGGGAYASEQKSRLVAGLLGIFLGSLGIHRFYLGYTGIGVAQIAVTLLSCGVVGGVWGLIEGIMILTGNSITRDAAGQPLKE